jgi:hypothetical protein
MLQTAPPLTFSLSGPSRWLGEEKAPQHVYGEQYYIQVHSLGRTFRLIILYDCA